MKETIVIDVPGYKEVINGEFLDTLNCHNNVDCSCEMPSDVCRIYEAPPKQN